MNNAGRLASKNLMFLQTLQKWMKLTYNIVNNGNNVNLL